MDISKENEFANEGSPSLRLRRIFDPPSPRHGASSTQEGEGENRNPNAFGYMLNEDGLSIRSGPAAELEPSVPSPQESPGIEQAPETTIPDRRSAVADPSPLSPDPAFLKATIEALLFTSDKPLPLGTLLSFFQGCSRVNVLSALSQIQEELSREDRGLELQEIAGGYVLSTKPALADSLKAFYETEKEVPLSLSALETLAIIAYKQPVTRAEIDAIRGVQSTGILQSLLDKDLIKIAGRKDVPGRPMMYAVTNKFLATIGLNSLNDLPKKEDVQS